MRLKSSCVALCAVLLASHPAFLVAQAFPSRTVRIVAGNQPGGPTDSVARIVAHGLAELWGQPVVVENRSGAGGTIGAEIVARAPADGYTLLVGGQTNLTAARAAYPDLRYDPLKDFAPIGRVATVPFAIAVFGRIAAATVPELVALARAKPGSLTYGSLGKAAMTTLPIHALEAKYGIRMLAVPYRGSATLFNDFIAGRIDVAVMDLSRLRPYAEDGTFRILASVGSGRTPVAPDVPTLADQQIDGIAFDAWYGLLAPAGTPPDVLLRLRDALQRIARDNKVRERLLDLDFVPVRDTPDAFRSAMALQTRELRALVAEAEARHRP